MGDRVIETEGKENDKKCLFIGSDVVSIDISFNINIINFKRKYLF